MNWKLLTRVIFYLNLMTGRTSKSSKTLWKKRSDAEDISSVKLQPSSWKLWPPVGLSQEVREARHEDRRLSQLVLYLHVSLQLGGCHSFSLLITRKKTSFSILPKHLMALNLLKDFKDRERKYIFYFIMIILPGSVWVVVIIKIKYNIYNNIFALCKQSISKSTRY